MDQEVDSSVCLDLDFSYTITPTSPIANKITTIIGIESKIPAMFFFQITVVK